ncbi:MAG: hypothetical protein WBC36_03710, partial [Desulfobacterales bacterium]
TYSMYALCLIFILHFLLFDLLEHYSLSQNNITFQPQDNSVSIGKNSQIKPRKSEQGQGL